MVALYPYILLAFNLLIIAGVAALGFYMWRNERP